MKPKPATRSCGSSSDDDNGPDAKKPRRTASSSCSMRVILDDSYVCPPPTVQVHVGSISDKRLISSVVKRVNELRPLPSLTHLKRVRRNELSGSYEIVLSGKDEADGVKSASEVLGSSVEGLADETTVYEVRKESF
jgi:hypothetical protein